MIFFRIKLLYILLVLCCIVSTANAMPAVKFHSADVAYSSGNFTPKNNVLMPACNFAVKEPLNFDLPLIQSDFLKPPVSSAEHNKLLLKGANSLPAVPAAVFMTFIGFLCVSWVKDRKTWLALLASVLWLGHAGILAVPHLALSMCQRTHLNNHAIVKEGHSHVLESKKRLRFDINGAKYISLLHYLEGLPKNKRVLQFHRLINSLNISAQAENILNMSQPAVVSSFTYFDNINNCAVAKTAQNSFFKPAFIFENLARGPPL